MVWLLNKHEYKIFNHNPLASVSIELRFHPILKIASGQAIPDFQDQIRSTFPDYKEGKVQIVNLGLESPVTMREEKQFNFLHPETQSQLTLSATSILLVCNNHVSRDETLEKFNQALDVLKSVCGVIQPIRLGVRYINNIQKEKISTDLGKPIDWSHLVKEDFLKMPANIANLNETSYLMELNSTLETGGITLRYGLLSDQPDENVKFRFDVDRYIAKPFDISQSTKMASDFIYDIYCLFTEMRNESLEEWMERN